MWRQWTKVIPRIEYARKKKLKHECVSLKLHLKIYAQQSITSDRILQQILYLLYEEKFLNKLDNPFYVGLCRECITILGFFSTIVV